MNEAKLAWRERTSKSKFVASVWTCNTPIATTRTVLADPCISIALISHDGNREVILRGPETKPRNELLMAGYTCTTIRLRPGVILQGFPAQRFVDSSLLLPADTASRFWFEGVSLHFPGFDTAELLIDQLHNLGYLYHEHSNTKNIRVANSLSPRSYFRLIKRTTGLSPYQLHQLERIHQALRLLKHGVPATVVATELNFADQPHLTRAAKQFLGHTPKQLLRLPQIP